MSEKLGPKSPMIDVFEHICPDEGLNVIPTKVPAPEGKAYLAVLIAGNDDEAHLVLANLMAYVKDMHDVAEQVSASKLMGSDGEPIGDEPTIIVP